MIGQIFIAGSDGYHQEGWQTGSSKPNTAGQRRRPIPADSRFPCAWSALFASADINPACTGRHAKPVRNRPLPQSVTRTTFSMDLPLSDELPPASHLLIGFNMWRRSLFNTNKLGKTMQFKYTNCSAIGCVCASLFQLDDVSAGFSRNNASLARCCKSHNYGICVNFQQNRAANDLIQAAGHSAASRWSIFPTKQVGATLHADITVA